MFCEVGPFAWLYRVVDFGPGTNVAEAFKAQKAVNPPGKSPPLCSEY